VVVEGAYEWDEAKNDQNIAKHGIDFTDVPAVFASPVLVRRDDRRRYPEERWIALGCLKTIEVVVIFRLRNERTRIISARRANRRERQVYRTRVEHA